MQSNGKLCRRLERKDKLISVLKAKVNGLEGESSRVAEAHSRVSELEGIVESRDKEISELRAEKAALGQRVEELSGLSDLESRNRELEVANKELAKKLAGLEIVCGTLEN